MRFLLAAALFVALAGPAPAGAAPAETAPAPKAGASQAASQDPAPAKPRTTLEERFKAANTTGDGRLTYAQAQAKMPRVAHNFEAMDKDRKGHVTLADIRAYDAERRAARKAAKAADGKAGQHSASAQTAPTAQAAPTTGAN